MFRVLIFLLLLAVAVDYFVYDGKYFADTGQYIQKVGRSINYEVAKYLDRGR
jgi:hypothetical protein